MLDKTYREVNKLRYAGQVATLGWSLRRFAP